MSHFDLYPKDKSVLVAPLCWGLGHATRCIPIVKLLLERNCTVTIASDGMALDLLKDTFPDLPFLSLPPYNVKYNGKNMVLDMLFQLPKIYKAFRKEQNEIQLVFSKYHWDYIISDHRYGIYHSSATNIFLCHQLNIQSNNAILTSLANKVHHHLITRFHQIWVPDYEDNRLAGKLSKRNNLSNVKFIGPLSQLAPKETLKKYDLVVILSGPEPARSLFEKKIVKVITKMKGAIAFVRGTSQNIPLVESENISQFALLNGHQISSLIAQSKMVLCRSGYSSIMDLTFLGAKAILVPTPGQTEQEYLAEWHKNNAQFHILHESELERIPSLVHLT